MNMSIEKMLSHVYEIEGLMLVTRRLGEENTPDVITNKIKRKVRELAEMCDVDIAPKPDEPNEPNTDTVPSMDSRPTEPAAPVTEHLPEEDYDADETWQHDNGEEFKEVFALDYMEPEHDEKPAYDNPVPVADREPDEDITVEFIEAPDEPEIPVETEAEPEPAAPQAVKATTPPATPQPPAFRIPVETNDEPTPEPDPAIVPEDNPSLEGIPVDFIDNDTVPEPEEEMPMPPLPTEFPEPAEATSPLRVDQKLQRRLSKDIRKAFSLNDRFRFQRELFAGSANAMDTAIEHIEVMSSYGNAELYFFSQLHWDRDNQDVKDFMEIVRNHFQ